MQATYARWLDIATRIGYAVSLAAFLKTNPITTDYAMYVEFNGPSLDEVRAVVVDKAVTVADVNAAVRKAAEGDLKGILQYTEEELVSSDYIGNPHSCILDAKCTNVVEGVLLKVSGWYDNEWGYASRCVDLLQFVGKQL